MKNLKDYGVQELNSKEKLENEGGFIPLLALLAIDVFMCGFLVGGYVALKTHD